MTILQLFNNKLNVMYKLRLWYFVRNGPSEAIVRRLLETVQLLQQSVPGRVISHFGCQN